MRNIKLLGLAAVAAMALMAFAASSASATALYSGETKLGVGAELDFSLKAGTKMLLTETAAEGGGTLDECSGSTVKGSIGNAGGASATVRVNLLSFTLTGCTFTSTTNILGGLEFHQIGTSTEGTVTAFIEIAWTINTLFFGSCVYGFESGTDLGVVKTGSSSTAEFTPNAVAKKLSGSNFACPATAAWKATYVGTTPDNLRVEAS